MELNYKPFTTVVTPAMGGGFQVGIYCMFDLVMSDYSAFYY